MIDYTLESLGISTIFSKAKIFFLPVRENNYSPQLFQSRIVFYFAVFLLFTKIVTAGFFIPLPKNIFFADVTKMDLLHLLNQSRQKIGINALSESAALDRAALLKAEDMIKHDYFAHQSPLGITPWFWFKQVDYKYAYAGENLAVGFSDSNNVYDAWFNSPGHKANLLNPNYKEVGTAIVSGFGANQSLIIVQLFGNPLSATVRNTATPTSVSQAVEAPQAAQNIAKEPALEPKEANVEAPFVDNGGVLEEPAVTIQEELPENEKNQVLSEKVLSQTTQYVSGKNVVANNTFYLRFLNFIVYDNSRIFQYMVYGCLFLVSAMILLTIIISGSVQNKNLVFRSLALIAILYVASLIDQDMISRVLPYQIVILA